MNTKIVRELTDIINKHSLENGSDRIFGIVSITL